MTGQGRTAKVLVLANSAWNLLNFRAQLMAELSRSGFQMIAVAPDGPGAEQIAAPFRHIPMRGDGLAPLGEARTLAALVKLLRRERPAALVTFTPKANIYGGLAAGLTGVPAIPNVSGLGTAFIRGGPLQALLVHLYRLAFRRCPVVFFQNPDDRDIFLSHGLVRPGQVRMLPGSGVDLARFKPAGERHPGPMRFLFVGRLLGDKGVREFAAAARLIRRVDPSARFTLLGKLGAANRSAVGKAELDGWIAEGLLDWAGETDDVRPFIAQADAVVLPSYREGLPRSLLEAAAMGRPVIATDVPGCREIVQHGVNGLLCEARSADSLAGALTQFIRLSNEERRRMGEAGRRIVEQGFGEERVVSAYLEVLRSVTA